MIRHIHRWRRGAAIMLASFGISACALYLDWDPAGLPCDEDKKCAEDYSCLVNRCVEEKSLPLETTCSLPEQCEGYPDVTCGAAPFTCRKVCRSLYGVTEDCEADEYCRPERGGDFDDQWTGTCFPSECHRDDDCRSDRVCVPISGTASACLIGCTYDFVGGAYGDTCGSDDHYCQALGKEGEKQLVCLEALGARQPVGFNCDPVDNPCQYAMTCSTGNICRQYCTTADNNCEANQYCGQVVNAGDEWLYSVCFDN